MHARSIATGSLVTIAVAAAAVRILGPGPDEAPQAVALGIRQAAERFRMEVGLTSRSPDPGSMRFALRPESGSGEIDSSGIQVAHDNDAHGGFRLPELLGPGMGLIDFDRDGDLDLFVGGGGEIADPDRGQSSRLYRNDAGLFTDVTASCGAAVAGPVYGVACADMDNDGFEDIYVSRLGANRLLRNQGDGTFVEIASTAGVDDPGFGTSVAFLDFDQDGLLDLYVANYVDWSEEKEVACYSILGERDYCSPSVYESAPPHVLYRNLGGGRFEDVSAATGIASERGQGLGVVASDFDGDGWTDIFVACDQTPGMLWHNVEGRAFENIALRAGCAYDARGVAIAGMGVACEDIDDDLDLDLVVTNIRDQMHLVLRNTGGMFEDISTRMGLGAWSIPATGFGIAVFDQDHDGSLDAYIANGHVVVGSARDSTGNPYAQADQFLRLDAGRFVDRSGEIDSGPAAVSRGVVKGDLDGDGDLDLVVSINDGTPRVLVNESGSDGHWLMVDARLVDERRRAIGARVTIVADGRTQVREIRPQESYLCSGDPRAHFGLGPSQRVDRITVRWPDGSTTIRSNVTANQVVVVEHGVEEVR